VVRTVLEQAELRAADPELERVQFRAITLAPRNGVRVVRDERRSRPAPTTVESERAGVATEVAG
jgi:hypothetical protein